MADADTGRAAPPASDTLASAERWRQVSDLLDAALDLPPAARAPMLASVAESDPALVREVEQLLHACEHAHEFLEEPAPHFAAGLLVDDAPALPAGARVGPFTLRREIGRGGMGAVYLAERDDPGLRQRVALKLVREGLGTPYLVRRFLEERRILASLEHANIARLVDGGVTAEGVPWFAMEYVEGHAIDRWCDDRRLAVDDRLALFRQVCDAVAYAHRNVVVHRDLKPSNILVTDDGTVKLLDFGIAKLLDAEAARQDPALTRTGWHPMTPEYASPEQVRGDAVSTASDVWALGVLLHLLLAGRHPHERARWSPHELAKAIVEREPPRPSEVVTRDVASAVGRAPSAAELAARRGTTPARLRARLRGDLDAIVLRALHRVPERRYPTTEQLSEDLRRHLARQPVAARAGARGYPARVFLRRHRWGVGVTLGAAALVLAFGGLSMRQARRVAAERDKARQVASFLVGLFNGSNPYEGSGRARTVAELLDEGADEVLRRDLGTQPAVRAELLLAIGNAYYGIGRYDDAVAMLDSSWAALRRLRGGGHPEALTVANLLAGVLRVRNDEARGDLARSESLYREILAARRQAVGDHDPQVARTLNGLGLALVARGASAEAEPVLREALAIDRAEVARASSGARAGLAQTLNNLGRARWDQGDLAEAEALHREALAVRLGLWGAEHFEASVSLANLAATLRDRGDLAGADSLFRRGMALRERLVGARHPDLASDRAAYAQLLHRRGELARSEALYRLALDVQRAELPPTHLATATTLLGLGRLLLDRGREAEGRSLLEESRAIRRARLGAGHRRVAEVEAALGAADR